jgi:S-adenosylmethionine hydrolase
MNPMNASGVITITTDFGHKGPFAAIMKGVILQRFPDARIIDLAHDIPAHWPPEAGFWISRSYRYFPSGTVHVAIVDPGVGTEREIILAEYDDHFFVAPDNGLLDTLLAMDGCVAYQLDADKLANIGVLAPSATFHGRDIFAPIAAEIAAGRLQVADIANVTDQWTPGWIEEPQVSKGQVSGVVVTIDAFGNLICNIERHHVEALQNPVVQVAGHKFDMATTYGRVQPGSYLALINSFDALEIARSEGNAAEGLGSDRGAPVIVSERLS